MENRDTPSLAIRFAGPLIFIISSTSALFWFGYRFFDLFNKLDSTAEVLKFDKGAFYMLGVGLGLAILSFVLVYEFWHGNSLTKKLTKTCTWLALFSVLLLLFFPQAMHFWTDNYLEEKGFFICEQASSQWLFVTEIVYVSGEHDCDQATKVEMTKTLSGR